MEEQGGADTEYIEEVVQKALDDAVYTTFGIKEGDNNQNIQVMYSKEKVGQWSSQIIDYTLRNLSKLNKPFKYCITCIIQQGYEPGLSVSAGLYTDTSTDGFMNIQKEINDILILASVISFAIL